MAQSKYASSRETTNLARVARIVCGPCTDVLRSVLKKEVKPRELIKKLKRFLCKHPMQNKINQYKKKSFKWRRLRRFWHHFTVLSSTKFVFIHATYKPMGKWSKTRRQKWICKHRKNAFIKKRVWTQTLIKNGKNCLTSLKS